MHSFLDGKNIVITGASGGIGRALVKRCAEQNACVGACFLNSGRTLRSLAADFPGRINAIQADVRSAAEVRERIGGYLARVDRCDYLLNCAGIGGTPQFLVHAKADVIQEVIAVNLLGTMYVSQIALQQMIRQRSGVILNFSSVSSTRPTAGVSAYAASKGGVESFTRAVGIEYERRGIRVNCLRLGPVRTSMTDCLPIAAQLELARQMPNGKLLEPDLIADAILDCLQPELCNASNGDTINLDGGYLLEHAASPSS